MMKKIISIIVSLSFVMCSCLVASAEEAPALTSFINNKHNIETLYYDENGNMVVITRDEPTMPMLEGVRSSAICESTNPLIKESRAETIFTSTLGPENGGRELWAKNEVSNDAIERMWIQCDGYYTTGSHIGTVAKTSDPAYTYQIMTAIVKVPASPFDSFRVGSGLSDHQYRDSRFKPVDHHLTWNVY